jgi:transcription elongation factor GreA
MMGLIDQPGRLASKRGVRVLEPPGRQAMDFITIEDKARLEQKLSDCYARRKQITLRIAEARALGDLSENAEYHAAREDQGLNEASIRQIEQQLSRAKVTDGTEIPDGIVFVGSTVRLRDVESGREERCRLVGQASGNLDDDCVEVTAESPMGQALLKARLGETVRVLLPRGEKRFEIAEIE